MMNKGAKYILYIPGELAYGVDGQQQAGIGPNATLIFEVEAIDVTPGK
ncbi:FKBP-type peptidyl-prolyl cis-trans isomerase [uncultured Duncaniella sp.]|nr:FKBP-type peptidyl-prolyl cis-trans isomerase [uncultured Duncaniella sp.]